MAYIQQQAQASAGDQINQTEVMSGTYEVQMNDSVEGKSHLTVGLSMSSTRNDDSIDPENQRQSLCKRGHLSTDNGEEDDDDMNDQSSSIGGTSRRHNDSNASRGSLIDGPGIKTPNSYKYPLLKRYYEFGPWIGRNRKAVCLGCHLQTSSSQPDRLLKHLNRCTALSEADKVAVQDLMNERTANKRKKPVSLKLKRGDNDDTEFYGEDGAGTADDISLGNCSIPIPASGLKKMRRDHPDKNSQIDEALTRFIMMCRIPLKAIHSPEFVELLRQLNPDYHIPSRETITNVLIPGLLNII